MHYKFSDIVDIPTIQELIESSYRISCIPVRVIDTYGTVLITTERMDIDSQIHSGFPEARLLFRERETFLQEHFCISGDLPKSGYIENHCKNGMMDIAVPIMIQGEHLASLLLGPFFCEPSDQAYLARKTSLLGFDDNAYLNTLKNVPVFSREKIEEILKY